MQDLHLRVVEDADGGPNPLIAAISGVSDSMRWASHGEAE